MNYWYLTFEVKIGSDNLHRIESVGLGFCSEKPEFPLGEAISELKEKHKKSLINPYYTYEKRYFKALLNWKEISKDQYISLGESVVSSLNLFKEPK